MRIVVDTNIIIFSPLLNTNGTIGNLLFDSEGILTFFSCDYMRFEIEKHWKEIKRISKLSDAQLRESRHKVFSKKNFIDEQSIPQKIWLESENTVRDIDIDDSDFVALNNYLSAYLWTGDKELYRGLKAKNYPNIFTTSELAILRNSLR